MKKILLLPAVVVILVLSRCSTDFDVNARWDDITVVYGLLDPNDTYHYVRVNKTFIGNASAEEMAAHRDSSEYKNIDVRIEEWLNKQKVREYVLRDTSIRREDDPNNIFYNSADPYRTVYYFREPALNSDATYKLKINIDNGRKLVEAETEVVDNFGNGNIKYPVFGIPINFNDGTDFSDVVLKFIPTTDAKRYQVSLYFYYVNKYFDGSQDTGMVPWVFQSLKNTTPDAVSQEMKITMSGETFYKLIDTYVPDLDPNGNIEKREPLTDIDIDFSIAGDELNTFMEVNEPATGIIQEKPEYTNVTNGIGIFSTRYHTVVKRQIGITGSYKTIDELVSGDIGQYTQNKGFCHPLDPNNQHYCY